MATPYKSAIRLRASVDTLSSVFLAMIVWPFPIARATMTPIAHVAGVLTLCVVALLGYHIVCVTLWRRTLGMRLAGLRLSVGEEDRGHVPLLRWGAATAVLVIPEMVWPGLSGAVGRWSGVSEKAEEDDTRHGA